ncbi:LOW QUALITY PROTEIN: flavin-binding monooxygenase [Aspergillus luchuensis]|uniref:Flavin-binding monooxygenase n=1 Tax=Aspergillus kawachii TaxID=1069201 RepID=A0A146FFP4_ASPKA|nr:LOW QUALITY PROTEIN: flavin-binding monooxygenase [Aspergillus luchuensis]
MASSLKTPTTVSEHYQITNKEAVEYGTLAVQFHGDERQIDTLLVLMFLGVEFAGPTRSGQQNLDIISVSPKL